MVRHKLSKLEECRLTFTGVFKGYNTKINGGGGKSQTILLKNIHDDKNKFICKHLWFKHTKRFQKINIKQGDTLQFDLRIKPYLKEYGGWENQELDYKISFPTKIRIIPKKRGSP